MKKNRAGISAGIVLIVSFLFLTAVILLGALLVNESKMAMRSLIQNRMLDISNTAASMIDGDVLGSLKATDKGTPPYQKINDSLAVFQNNIELQYIYTIGIKGDKEFIFLVDPTVDDPGEFGEPVVYTDALYAASCGKPSVDDEPYEDAWGRFYSSYTPVFNSKGEVAGIVAVDFRAAWIDNKIAEQTRIIVLYSVIMLGFMLLLLLITTRKLRRTLSTINVELEAMATDVDALMSDLGIESKPVFTKAENTDDVAALSQIIHEVYYGLRKYVTSLHSQANSMITALSSEYRSVYYVNLDENEGVCYRSHSKIDNAIKEGEKFNYLETMKEYAQKYIVDKYMDGFLEFIEPDYIRKALKEERIITIRYIVNRKGTMSYEMLRMAGIRNSEGQSVIHEIGMGFTDVDEETRRTLSQRQALSEALSSAENANKAKTAFLSNMSHEIRTPMNAIIGLNSFALKDDSLSPKTREHLKKVEDSAKHLLGLINDVLDMSRIESGRMVLRKEKFSFGKMLDQVKTLVSSQCSEKGLRFDCVTNGEFEKFYVGDDMKLKQVLINTLSNAIKFTDAPGNITLSLEETASFDDRSTLKFTVKDTGIGMSEEFLPKLFDSFTQENGDRNNKYGSTGLGMAITKSIVDMMNGAISVKSKKGVGTEVEITVTLQKGKEDEESVNVDIENLSVLIVDDDSIAAEHAKIVLNDVGIKADICSNGKDALEMFETRYKENKPYKLALLDWKMPEMDGVEIAKTIVEKYDNETAIIFLTAYNWDEVLEEALHAGIDGFLSKPVNASSMLDEFERVIRKNTATAKEKPRAELKGKRILLAEDIAVNAEIMTQVLYMKECEVEVAQNGKIAADMFEKSEEDYYDAILMDIRMPEMDGLESTKIIRKLQRADAKKIPIIAMTANAFDEDVQQSLQAGMNAHLTKPVEPESVYRILAELIYEAATCK